MCIFEKNSLAMFFSILDCYAPHSAHTRNETSDSDDSLVYKCTVKRVLVNLVPCHSNSKSSLFSCENTRLTGLTM